MPESSGLACLERNRNKLSSFQVGYLKAIDIWVISCFVFLAVAVTEVILLFVLSKRAAENAKQDQFELIVYSCFLAFP